MTITSPSAPEKWTDEEISAWFNNKEWLEGWNVQPDASINKRNFAIYYHKNPKQWKMAFRFLAQTDLTKLAVGKTELDGKNLFVSVDEYTTKDKSETRYEAHQKYIDIQYMISGEEQMGLCTHDKMAVTAAYDEKKDVEFYDYDGGNYLKATPQNFVVFFPDDVHRPCIKLNENIPIKKIVVKLSID
ncbi:YhcH/YjgK/YiaL family protein [uncultured Draconibacterium sp.]|uniref:YhcH/YjgK/YiaL family protein n=1 Tax=uncultured Draconibacterium sp. TaxID=1573823 RepID=UPI003216282E